MKYYLGVDLGGTNISAGVLDSNFNIISKAEIKTNLPRKAELIMDDIFKIANEAMLKIGIDLNSIDNIGVGCPGTINCNTGVIEYANNLKFNNVRIRDYLENKFNKPIYIDNDANAAALGEFLNYKDQQCKCFITITLGTGVGSGVIIDGKIYSGFNFAASELGHTILELNGRSCTCGRNGCFEAYCSATALINITKEFMHENKDSKMWDMCNGDINNVSGKTSFDCMRLGDIAAQNVVDKYIYYLSNGIVNIVNAFQPNVICIGGGISKEKNYLLDPLIDLVSKYSYCKNKDMQTKLMIAKLSSNAGVVGAALLGK